MNVELALNKFIENSIKHKIKEDDDVPYSEHQANLIIIFCFSIADKIQPKEFESFIIENKIFELKKAMELDQIDPSEAVAICQRFKDHYWFMDAPEMFSEIEQAHKKALQDYYFRYDLKITNKEIEKEFFNYVKYLIKRRNRIFEDLIIQLNSSISQHNESKKIKEFSEYLFHHKRDQLAEELKKEFEGSKGKNIKLMLMSLQEKGLGSFFGNRQFKSVFDSMTAYFPWNIGTYPSINDYKNDKVGYEAINSKVTFIINQLESTNK